MMPKTIGKNEKVETLKNMKIIACMSKIIGFSFVKRTSQKKDKLKIYEKSEKIGPKNMFEIALLKSMKKN